VRVAVLGGTGSFGRALAARLAAAGQDEIVIGSRDAARARETAAELGGGVTGDANEDAVHGADLVVLAVKADGALDTARAVAFQRGVGALPDPDARSLAERIQDEVAGPVVAGLHSVAAANLDGEPPDEDALVCGDDQQAKALALELAARIVAGSALDAGPLAGARTLEGLTAVIVNLNRRYKAHTGVRVTGVSTTAE
jgi:predicted dinucleotide-binding enzyme